MNPDLTDSTTTAPFAAAASAPRVGVVIRTKDRPLFVTRALRTVLAQAYDGWRVVLVNDGGDAAVLDARIADEDLAPPFADGRMTRLDLPASVGRSEAFNTGVRALETEFVCCLDDDDTWEPDFMGALLALIDRVSPLAADLGGAASLVTAVCEDIVTDEDGTQSLLTLGTDTLPHSFRRTEFFLNPIAYATYRHDLYPVQWMLNRAAVLEAGGFPTDFNVMEDRAFMIRFLERRSVAILDQPLAFHHRRVRRADDKVQDVAMNTLDNPSYDWRLFSDLSKIQPITPPGTDAAQPVTAQTAGELIRSAAATVIKELNDETSALWHKLNGEAMGLRARIEELEARIGAVDPRPEVHTPADERVWSLWDCVGETALGYPLSATQPFLERFSLSMPTDQPGLMLHASPDQRRMVVQVPDTGDFTALELSLGGLAEPKGGLRCELIVSIPEGCLFQTALSLWVREGLTGKAHRFEERHIHSCPPGGSIRIERHFSAPAMGRGKAPKLSIILPARARDFRLCCHDLVVSQAEGSKSRS